MGQRISFYRNNSNVDFKELLLENYAMFRQWYLDTATSSLKEYNEPSGSEELRQFLLQNNTLRLGSGAPDKRILDELTSEFVGSYCDLTDGKGEILELFGPCLNKWRYEGSTSLVLQTKDRMLIGLWNWLVVRGRSLRDNGTFEGLTDDLTIGFLACDERRTLQNRIEIYFGTTEHMREKYWTNSEKKALQEAMAHSKDGSYSLSGHNPVSSGLEYVLTALTDMADCTNEIITAIE